MEKSGGWRANGGKSTPGEPVPFQRPLPEALWMSLASTRSHSHTQQPGQWHGISRTHCRPEQHWGLISKEGKESRYWVGRVVSASAASWGHTPSAPPQGSQLLGELKKHQSQMAGPECAAPNGRAGTSRRECVWAAAVSGQGAPGLPKQKWSQHLRNPGNFCLPNGNGKKIQSFFQEFRGTGKIIKKNILLVPSKHKHKMTEKCTKRRLVLYRVVNIMWFM